MGVPLATARPVACLAVMVRVRSANRLAVLYLVVGAGLFFYAAWWLALGFSRSLSGLAIETGEPLEPVRAVRVAAPPPAKPVRYVPPATPTVPLL